MIIETERAPEQVHKKDRNETLQVRATAIFHWIVQKPAGQNHEITHPPTQTSKQTNNNNSNKPQTKLKKQSQEDLKNGK